MKRKRISFISKTVDGWYKDELEKAANKFGLDFKIVDIADLNNLKDDVGRLGDLVFYRASSLDLKVGRTTFLSLVGKNRIVVNQAIYKTPLVANKLYQQKIIEKVRAIDGIDSFQFKELSEVKQAVKQGRLKYPFIMKASLSARGEKVFLIKHGCDEVEQYCEKPLNEYIFQNFIENSGDFRVLVLGGKALGAMRRVAAKGEFKNNISLGGTGSAVTDKSLLSILARIAVKTAALFGLQFCGVDIIYDEKEDRYKVMEINTVAQWQGFQGATGVVVADQLMAYFKSLTERDKKSVNQLVLENYDASFDFLYSNRVHYASRLFLWLKRDIDKERLTDLKADYLGVDQEEQLAKLREILVKEQDLDKLPCLAKKIRMPFFKKYPSLLKYDSFLFSVLFAHSLYDIDLRDCLDQVIDKADFVKLNNALKQDLPAIAALSTMAINFFYNSQFCFHEDKDFKVDLDLILKAANSIDENKSKEWLRLKFYLLTHAIIGASQFYYKKIDQDLGKYQLMIKQLEQLITDHLFDIGLDNKLEFLVCCRLLNYKTNNEKIILAEAENSLSDLGNFLVDKWNNHSGKLTDEMQISEHRNVLYLMASLAEK